MVLDLVPGRCSSPRGRPGTLWTWNACQDCVIIFQEEGKDTQSEPLHLPSIGIAQRREAEVSWPTGPREKLRRLRENKRFSVVSGFSLTRSFPMDCDFEAAETEFIVKSKPAALYRMYLQTSEYFSGKMCNSWLSPSSLLKRFTSTEVCMKTCTYIMCPYV